MPVQENPTDVLHLSGGRTMSRDLHRKHKRVVRLFALAAFLPLLMLMLYAWLPTSLLVTLAIPVNDLLWSHFKSISLETCGTKCSLVAFSMIAVPLSWGAGILFGLAAIPLTIQLRRAQVEALAHGFAPLGRRSDGTAKPLLHAATALGVATTVVLGAMLLAVVYGLYIAGGSDRTTHPRTGVEYSLAHVSVLLAILMGAVQCGSMMLMGIATLIVLDLKILLRVWLK